MSCTFPATLEGGKNPYRPYAILFSVKNAGVRPQEGRVARSMLHQSSPNVRTAGENRPAIPGSIIQQRPPFRESGHEALDDSKITNKPGPDHSSKHTSFVTLNQ
jgi:hypothetical protein